MDGFGTVCARCWHRSGARRDTPLAVPPPPIRMQSRDCSALLPTCSTEGRACERLGEVGLIPGCGAEPRGCRSGLVSSESGRRADLHASCLPLVWAALRVAEGRPSSGRGRAVLPAIAIRSLGTRSLPWLRTFRTCPCRVARAVLTPSGVSGSRLGRSRASLTAVPTAARLRSRRTPGRLI